jgi:hypothetical protein
VDRRALALSGALAGASVLLLFHFFHSVVDHALAIALAAAAGVVLGALGYRWQSGDSSRAGIAAAGALAGLLGLFVLHLLPLLR